MNDLANKSQELKRYSFKLLREEAVDTDVFEDNTHEKIAHSIFKLVESEESGITIGLEGSWGSGKSTVISILRKKLNENNSSIPLIQFDAWAHEGDPLRRIFLESLIDEIKSEVEVCAKLDDLKEKIAHRKKTKKIKTTHSTTALGKWLSLAIFFVPIGVAFLSKVDYSSISTNGSPYWLFIVGLLLSGAPLLVVIVNLIRILCNKDLRREKVFNSKNWSFLQAETDKNIIQEVSEEDERSSIEFERYFNQIMEVIFKDSKIRNVIIVVDDLDRIDKHDSLKIWSTLQTFLQQRNQTWNKKEWFDKIWIIVPYDPDGLSRLWDRNPDNIEHNTSKSFFDKCFQLRLEVPKPIFSGWEKFARDMIDHALEDWAQNDKDELIRILRITRKSLDDVPTPREIKNYINQAGFLASQWGAIMPISSIAYYVCRRELENKSVNDIKAKLVKNELIDSTHKALLPESCVKDLSGLVFGVAPEKGVQLLLEPEIAAALKNADEKKLDILYQSHGEGFWSIFNYHFEHFDMNLHYALTSAKAISNSIWKDHNIRCSEFINRVVKVDLSINPEVTDWSEQNMDKYICLIKVCDKNKPFIRGIYHSLINGLSNSIDKDEDVKWAGNITSLSKAVNTTTDIDMLPSQEIIDKLSLPKLIPWANASKSSDVKTYNWFAPPKNIIEEIKNAIVVNKPLQEGLFEAIQYTIDAGIESGWDTVLTRCQQYINLNNGNYSNQSDEIFNIINVIVFKFHSSDKISPITRSIVGSGQYHNLLWHRRSQNLIYAVLLCGYVFKGNLDSIAIPNIENSTAGFDEIKNFWIKSNVDNAKKVFVEIKKYNLWSFLWELTSNAHYKLVKDIIALALEDEDAIDLFRVKSGLVKLKYFSTLFEDNDGGTEKVTKLIEKFIKHAELEKELIDINSIDLIKYDYESYLIIKQTKNYEVITKIANELKGIDKGNWSDALSENSWLTPLALEIKKRVNGFFLEKNFTDAFIELANRGNCSDWQKDHWQELTSLMDDSFKKYYRQKITDFLRNNMQTISLNAFNLNRDFFLYPTVIDKTEVLENALDEFVKSENIERLKFLSEILSKDTKNKFSPKKYFSDVMKNPLQELYSKQENGADRSVLKHLAEKFQINLSESSEDRFIEQE